MCECVHMPIWKSDVDIGCLSPLLSILFLESGFLTEPVATQRATEVPLVPQCWCYRYVPGFYTGAGDQTWVSYAVWLSHLKLVLTLTDRAISPALCSCSHHLVGKHFSVADVLKTILTTVTIQPYRLIALSLLLKILLVIFIVCICL